MLNYPAIGTGGWDRTTNLSPIKGLVRQLSYSSMGCPEGFEPSPHGSQPRRASDTRRDTGAAGRTRTSHLVLTKDAFCQMNYGSMEPADGLEPSSPDYRAG